MMSCQPPRRQSALSRGASVSVQEPMVGPEALELMFSKLLPKDGGRLPEQSEAVEGHDFDDAPCVSSPLPLELQVLLGS